MQQHSRELYAPTIPDHDPLDDDTLWRCPTCGTPRPFDAVSSALLAHLLAMEEELAQVRKLVEEVVL